MASLALNIVIHSCTNKLAFERLTGDAVSVTATKSLPKPLTVLCLGLLGNKR